MNTRFFNSLLSGVGIVAMMLVTLSLNSCNKKILTPENTKQLEAFHRENFEPQEVLLQEGLNLYVDYSTCNKLGQSSKFFQSLTASMMNDGTAYFSIKGSEIQQEEGEIYSLLRNIREVNYADLKQAANRMAESECQSVLITDGEYFQPTIAKGHDNDPYLAEAFKSWILKGYDIHIISEPYTEPYNGKIYNKKRFYIIFTDDRLENNIYQRICRTTSFEDFPEVDQFHISAAHPKLFGNGNNCSTQNEILNSKSKGWGSFEIENWDGCDWKTIEDMIVNGVDEETGEPLEYGVPIISMGLDRNSFGCYRINGLNVKAYDINQEYADYCSALEINEKPAKVKTVEMIEIENLLLLDKKAFENDIINISFNQDWFDPSFRSGKPYNYLKIDLSIADIESIFSQHEEKFEFESITNPGEKNVSVASSIKQCLADDNVIKKMKNQVIYSIYVKSEEK